MFLSRRGRHRPFRVFPALILLAVIAIQTQFSFGQDDVKLYFFTSDGCAPCRQVEPAIEALYREGYPVSTVHAGRQMDWVRRFRVDRTPTVILVKDSRIVGRHAGLIDAVTLKKWFKAVGVAAGTNFQDRQGKPIGKGTKVKIDNGPESETSPRERSADQPNDEFQSATLHEGTRVARNQAEASALEATVLLRVEDDEGISYATGTVIHSHENESLVITCGHVFRESAGNGEITASYGFGDRPTTASGDLIYFDADARDIALVAIRTPKPIKPVRIAASTSRIAKGRSVFSIGCDHGEPPTIRRTQIKSKASYDGAIKYDIFGRPVDGRSGGGLFTANGELIGVCNAAAVEVDEGIYSSLETVYWQLETVNLRHLFGQEAPTTRLASNNQLLQIDPQPMKPLRRNDSLARQTSLPPLVTQQSPRRTPVAWNRNDVVSANDREVIIIVRSKSNPSRAETITISDPTPQLLDYLNTMPVANKNPKRTFNVAEMRTDFR